MPDHARLDVVCVVWNESERDLARYGSALAAAVAELPAGSVGSGIVVCNGARDVTCTTAAAAVEQALGRRPDVVRSPENAGFAHGANLGFARASSGYVALLDPDGAPEPALLRLLVEELDRTPDAAVASARVVDFGALAPGPGDPHDEPWCPGGASVYRRAALEELGGFDELFAGYCEDMDFGHRARRAGWRCRRVPAAVLRHPSSRRATIPRIRRLTEYSLGWHHVHFGRRVALKACIVQLPMLLRHNRSTPVAALAGGAAGIAAYLRRLPDWEAHRT